MGRRPFVPAGDPERNDAALLAAITGAEEISGVRRMGAWMVRRRRAAAAAYAGELDPFAAAGEPLFDLLLLAWARTGMWRRSSLATRG